MMTLRGDTVTAVDLTQVVMVSSFRQSAKSNVLTSSDLEFQEVRRARKVRKLDFEVR